MKIKFTSLLEKKDHLIKKIPKLTQDEKDELINFFNKKPNLENKIDWNNYANLTFKDFESVMNETKTEKIKKVKSQGISGLKEGTDYFKIKGEYEGYIPLSWEASKFLASKYVGDCEGKWCVAYQKNKESWLEYIFDEKPMIFIYLLIGDTKYAIGVYPTLKTEIYDADDNKISKISNVDVKQIVNDNKNLIDNAKQIIYNNELNDLINTKNGEDIYWFGLHADSNVFNYEKALDVLIDLKDTEHIEDAGIYWKKFNYEKALDALIDLKDNQRIYYAGIHWKKFNYKKGLEALIKLNDVYNIYNALSYWKIIDKNKLLNFLNTYKIRKNTDDELHIKWIKDKIKIFNNLYNKK
jgi:hypothetical protein